VGSWADHWHHIKAHSLCEWSASACERRKNTSLWGSRERSWCEPEILRHDSAGLDDLGSGPSLAQVPEDAVNHLVGHNVEETLRLDERPDAGGTEHLEALGTRPVGVGEHRAVDQLEVAAEQLPVRLERPQ